MFFSNGQNTFVLKHTEAVTVAYLETVYKYIQTIKHELIDEYMGVVDQHWHLLQDSKEGDILVVLTPTSGVGFYFYSS